MILIAAFALGLLTVPLAGGNLRGLAALELRRPRVLAAAFFLQLIALKAPIPEDLATWLNMSTYFMGAWYLVANLNVPGMWLVAMGTAGNMLAMLANGGVMPASAKALAAAGLTANPDGFTNSTLVANAQVSFLGDIFSVPRSWPINNVFSVGDVLIVLGALVAVHRLCGSRLFPQGSPEFRKLRQNRNFMALWTAQAASNMGDWVYTMAVFASLGKDANPRIFATLLIAEVAPSAVAGILGGPLVDRLPRRMLMITADLVRAAAVASLFLDGNQPSLAHLYSVAVVLGVMRALSQPALQASLPNVVAPDQLVAANSLVSATYHSAVMIGPVIGGLLVAHIGVEPAFAVNGASFALSALMVMRVHLPPQPPTESWNPVAELREGLRYSLSTPLVRGLMVVIGMVMIGAAIKSPTEPAFVFQRLGGDATMLGMVTGTWGVGMVIGTVLAPAAVRAWRREQLLWAGIGIVGLCLLATSRASNVVPMLLLYLFAGGGNGLGSVCYETLLQERTPDHLRGRVLAACDAAFDLALLGGYALTGLLDARFGPRAMFAVAGGVFLLAALLGRMLIGEHDAAPVRAAVGGGEPDPELDMVSASVAVLRIYDADKLLPRREAARVLGNAGSEVGDRHVQRVGAVGRDDAVGRGPERVSVGQGLGVRDVESGAADAAVVERVDKVVGHDVRAAGDVDEPGVLGHDVELGGGDDAAGLGREGEGEDHGVGVGQGRVQLRGPEDAMRRWRVGSGSGVEPVEPVPVEPVESVRVVPVEPVPVEPIDRICPTCSWLGLSADECCLDSERLEQPKKRLGDPARTKNRHLGAEQGPARGLAPTGGARPLVEVP